MTDTNTTLPPAQPVVETPKPVLSAEEQLRNANGQPGSKTIPTDEYIQKRAEENSKKRGGFRAKIHQLTKEAAEAKKTAKEIKEQLTAIEAKQAAPVVVQTPAPVAAPAPAVDPDKPDPRPKRDDFKDDTEHTQAIAEWVVRQQNRIIAAKPAELPKPAEPPKLEPPKEIQFDPNNATHVQLKKEFDGFVIAGQAFIKSNPDFTERLNAAAGRGLTLDNQAQRAIIRMAAPELLYYLAAPENEQVARSLMALDGAGQVLEIGKLAERLKVKPTDFVSNAPPPGQHLTNGSTRATIPRDQMDPDDYIKMRIQERRSSKFRH